MQSTVALVPGVDSVERDDKQVRPLNESGVTADSASAFRQTCVCTSNRQMLRFRLTGVSGKRNLVRADLVCRSSRCYFAGKQVGAHAISCYDPAQLVYQ